MNYTKENILTILRTYHKVKYLEYITPMYTHRDKDLKSLITILKVFKRQCPKRYIIISSICTLDDMIEIKFHTGFDG